MIHNNHLYIMSYCLLNIYVTMMCTYVLYTNSKLAIKQNLQFSENQSMTQ